MNECSLTHNSCTFFAHRHFFVTANNSTVEEEPLQTIAFDIISVA